MGKAEILLAEKCMIQTGFEIEKKTATEEHGRRRRTTKYYTRNPNSKKTPGISDSLKRLYDR